MKYAFRTKPEVQRARLDSKPGLAGVLPSGAFRITAEVPDATLCATRPAAAVMEVYDGEIHGLEGDLVYAVLTREGLGFEARLNRADFEIGGPLDVGQTFKAEWIEDEAGIRRWRHRPDPPKSLTAGQVKQWIRQAQSLKGSGL